MAKVGQIKIRNYDDTMDRGGVEDLERRCEVGPRKHVLTLFTDTMGDPICRIRNSPIYNMLVAELSNELVGVIQGSIKVVTFHKAPKERAKMGYILGLRVSKSHRRKGIGSTLVHHMEAWFISNQVDYAYMATEKDNKASVKLFLHKLGYLKFRTPAILVNPVSNYALHMSSDIEIVKLKIEQAELLYRRFMSSTEFFPHDIDKVLGNKLSLGTWVAYFRGRDDQLSTLEKSGLNGIVRSSWAMVSVWNSGEIFKLRVGEIPLTCFLYSKRRSLMNKVFPCFKVPLLPEFRDPFGLYFMYGLHGEGPASGKLVNALCKFVHNMGMKCNDCKVIVTEDCDKMKRHIPHWKLLSCPEDLWCIKALKNNGDCKSCNNLMRKTSNLSKGKSLFVDPREV